MPKFEKGNPGKPAGAKNKVNTEVRGMIQKLFDDNYDKIQQDLEDLDPKDRLKFLADLLPYLAPKLQSTTHSTEIDLEGMSEEQLDKLIERIIDA